MSRVISLSHAFSLNPHCAFGGSTVNSLAANRYAAASQILIDFLYEYYGKHASGHSFFTSNNLAFPTAALREMGGFAPTFHLAAGEDRELCDRRRGRGGTLIYEPAAVVWHAHDLRLFSFWRQHFYYGRGAYQFHRRRVSAGESARRWEPLAFYASLAAYPFASGSAHPIALSGLLTVAQMANAAGYLREKVSRESDPAA